MTRYVLKGERLSQLLTQHDVIEGKLVTLQKKYPQMEYEVDITASAHLKDKIWTITIEVNDGEQEITEFREGIKAH